MALDSIFEDNCKQFGDKEIKEIREALLSLYNSDYHLFKHNFVEELPQIEGKPLNFPKRKELEILANAGIIEKNSRKFFGKKRVYVIKFPERKEPLFLLSDGHVVDDYMRTYSPKDLESGIIARQIDTKKGKLLDMCAGVGTHGISAVYRLGRHIISTCVEINERAIIHGEFNAKLNGVFENVKFIKSDLYKDMIFPSSEKEKYDCIVFNAPFVPTPPGIKKYLHSDGGPRGDDLPIAVLNGVPHYLKERGKCLFAVYTLGTKNVNSTRTLNHLLNQFPTGEINIEYRPPAWSYKRGNESIANLNPVPIDDFAFRFEDKEVIKKVKEGNPHIKSSRFVHYVEPWLNDLKKEGNAYIHYAIVTVVPLNNILRLNIQNRYGPRK